MFKRTKRIDVRLEPDQLEMLRELADDASLPMGGMVRHLIMNAYDVHEKRLAKRNRNDRKGG